MRAAEHAMLENVLRIWVVWDNASTWFVGSGAWVEEQHLGTILDLGSCLSLTTSKEACGLCLRWFCCCWCIFICIEEFIDLLESGGQLQLLGYGRVTQRAVSEVSNGGLKGVQLHLLKYGSVPVQSSSARLAYGLWALCWVQARQRAGLGMHWQGWSYDQPLGPGYEIPRSSGLPPDRGPWGISL